MMDNTTAVACVMKMGTSHSMLCNEMTQLIWGFCIERNIWLSAAFIPGKLNVEADEESRKLNMDAEWCIKEDILVDALSILNFKYRLKATYHSKNLKKQTPKSNPHLFRVDWG